MNTELEQIQKEIEEIKERNKRVEADKKWETSFGRKIIIALTTYILIGIYMSYLDISKPWLNALVPTAGFVLSTLTLSWIKSIWLNTQRKR